MKLIESPKTLFILAITTVALLITICIISVKKPNETQYNETMKDIKALDKQIDTVHSQQSFLIERMFDLEKKSSLLEEQVGKNNSLIESNTKELTNLRKTYNEKINRINTYNTQQLEKFFSDRYPGYDH